MAQEATLHVKVEPRLARGLKLLAKSRNQTMGELVRNAITACYQPDLAGLTREQQDALSAYRGGYISLGKLAEAMGLHALTLRTWLREHQIPENNVFGQEDASHA